jgi:hypothetical protein
MRRVICDWLGFVVLAFISREFLNDSIGNGGPIKTQTD